MLYYKTGESVQNYTNISDKMFQIIVYYLGHGETNLYFTCLFLELLFILFHSDIFIFFNIMILCMLLIIHDTIKTSQNNY